MRILLPLVIAIFAVGLVAQTPSSTPMEEADYIVPARPTVSNPAEFQRPGVLQLEIGYDANFNSGRSYNNQQDVPIALRFAVNRRILVELDTDSPYSLKDPSGITETGAGDTQIGIQAVLVPENKSRPGASLAYYVKLPTAEEAKGLGTGRVDHSFIGLVSKTMGKTTVDFNAIYLLAGKTSSSGHALSGQGAVALTRALSKKIGVQGEVSGYSRNDQQPGAMFGLAVATYQIDRRVVLDCGLRFGLTPEAPKVGFVTGVTFGIASFYKKLH